MEVELIAPVLFLELGAAVDLELFRLSLLPNLSKTPETFSDLRSRHSSDWQIRNVDMILELAAAGTGNASNPLVGR